MKVLIECAEKPSSSSSILYSSCSKAGVRWMLSYLNGLLHDNDYGGGRLGSVGARTAARMCITNSTSMTQPSWVAKPNLRDMRAFDCSGFATSPSRCAGLVTTWCLTMFRFRRRMTF